MRNIKSQAPGGCGSYSSYNKLSRLSRLNAIAFANPITLLISVITREAVTLQGNSDRLTHLGGLVVLGEVERLDGPVPASVAVVPGLPEFPKSSDLGKMD